MASLTDPLASLADIGLMICESLISRGSRKDFYDLFLILMVLASMTVFDNADSDVQPVLFDNTPWNEVKKFSIEQARLLRSMWFG